MAIELAAAKRQVKRLSVLPFWAATSSATFTELVDLLRANADDETHAARAISKALLGSAIPRPSDLIDYLNETRAEHKPEYPGGCCGRISEKYCLADGTPSQCENGVIRHTVWKQHPILRDNDGRPIVVRYDFSGYCICQPGGDIRL